jgi:hypothetical protein
MPQAEFAGLESLAGVVAGPIGQQTVTKPNRKSQPWKFAENTMSLRNNEFLGRTVPRGGFLGDLQANPQYPSPKPGSENEVSELRTDRNDLLTKNAAPDLSLPLDVPQKKFLHV